LYEESCSFLKKRTKKILSVSGGTALTFLGLVPQEICKSFLLLFFKKEAFLSSTLGFMPCLQPLPARDYVADAIPHLYIRRDRLSAWAGNNGK
jgi:hypothetical protein